MKKLTILIFSMIISTQMSKVKMLVTTRPNPSQNAWTNVIKQPIAMQSTTMMTVMNVFSKLVLSLYLFLLDKILIIRDMHQSQVRH